MRSVLSVDNDQIQHEKIARKDHLIAVYKINSPSIHQFRTPNQPSHGILAGPFPGGRLVPLPVILVHVGNVGN